MALIKFQDSNRLEKTRNYVHGEVDCTYSVFYNGDGNKYFQIDTYGSRDRQIRDKISQSVQIDYETAKRLVQVLVREFNIKID